MTQDKCLKILKENDWMSSKELAEKLNQDQSNLNKSLRRLLKSKEVERRLKENSIPKVTYEWRIIYNYL